MTAAVVPHAAGFEAQLLRITSAQLYLVDGDETLLMKHDDFVVRLTKQSDSPLAVVLASVGDIHWPLGKDSPTLWMHSRHFVFVLTGVIYGLVLPESTSAQVLAQLEVLLAQYTTFENCQERNQTGGVKPLEYEKPTHFSWTTLAPEILRSCVKFFEAMCNAKGSALTSKILEKSRAPVSAVPWGKGNSNDSGGLDPTPRCMKRVQQARRISAVSKLLSRTLVRGALSASNHIVGPAKAQATMDRVALASADTICKIVDAVESAGKSILSPDSRRKGSFASTNDFNQADNLKKDFADRIGSRSGTPSSSWTLNRTGLALLFSVTAASAKLYSNYRSSDVEASSTQDYTSFSTGHENVSDDFQANSSPSQSSAVHSPLTFPGAPDSLSELPLFPSHAFDSSPGRHKRTQELSSCQFAPAQQQQPVAVPTMPSSGFTRFFPTNSHVSNKKFGQNYGLEPPDKQQFCHLN